MPDSLLIAASLLYFGVIALWPALLAVAVLKTRRGAVLTSRVARLFAGSRRVLGVVLCLYGVVKLVGIQLTRQTVTTPLNEVPPDVLFWYFFSYSRGYVLFVGLAEVACGLMLLWRRTDRLGVLLGAALLSNIVSLDVAYEVGRVAVWAAGLLVGCAANVVAERGAYRAALDSLLRPRA